MPTASSTGSTLADHEIALLSGAWSALGVSGFHRTHDDWAIDPEPLIIRTATVGDADARLSDEALDWCVHYGRYVSSVRLKNLLRAEDDDHALELWGAFAATVNKHSGASWPGATRPFRFATTGRSSLESMDQPARAWLRLRAMFGVGARSEVIRYFLSGHRRATVASIATAACYTKRNVADACDALEKAGVLTVHEANRRFTYALARGAELRAWVGDIAQTTPDWVALLSVSRQLVELEARAPSMSHDAVAIEAHRVARSIEDDLDALDVEERPNLRDPDVYWTSVRDFADRYLAAWGRGDLEPAEVVADITPVRRTGPRPALHQMPPRVRGSRSGLGPSSSPSAQTNG